MLIYAAGEVADGQQPAWVKQWLDSRAEREAKKAEKAVDVSPEKQAERAEAQDDRRAKRLETVTQGMDDLRVWLEDLVRTGLAAAPSRGFRFFEERAKRLIDVQAPGAARLVREMGSAASSGDGWQTRMLESAGLIYLLAEATARLDDLPDDLRQDVLVTLGIPTPKEAIDAAPVVHDIWQVIGREMDVEANLKTQRTYLFGVTTQRPALLLDFAYGNAGLDVAVPVGTLFPADIAFYPGRSLRAVVRSSTQDVAPLTLMQGLSSIPVILDLHANLLGERPWLDWLAVPLTNVRPTFDDGHWWIVDNEGNALPLSANGRSNWMALAISVGHAVSVGVKTDGKTARLLSIVDDGVFTDLVAPKDVAA
ncbi:MAG TPA: hypothetical protein VFE58_00905 [Tepidisphaeraceae bacterium]|jgi:hypothetical protein|nr:hypothetical protein [Tepidisphaeraceae bacterium]